MREDLYNAVLEPDERRVLDDVAEYGWHVVGIEAEGTSPAWAFTIGLHETYRHPEVLIMGLPVESLMEILNGIGESVKGGAMYRAGMRYGDVVAGGFDCGFDMVDTALYGDYAGFALWFYGGPSFPMLQCLWPDKANRLPGDPGFPERLAELQQMTPLEWGPSVETVLGEDADWPFNEPRNVAVFTTGSIVRRGLPILHVAHDVEDGAWQFMDGGDFYVDDAMVVSLKSVFDRDPSIGELANLPEGWIAWRESIAAAWKREPHAPDCSS